MLKFFRKKSKYAAASAALALAVTLSACGASASPGASASDSSGDASAAKETTTATAAGYAAEMDKNAVMTIEISADPEEWQTMLDNATAEEYISVDVTINGTTVKNVGIRPKGNSSLSSVARDEDSDRYSFKIKFDQYVDGQTWLGLDELALNSGYSDATSMKEYLSYDIMNYIGVETILYAYADIALNGETWGLYLALEDYEGSYKERAQNDEGELYKPESMEMGGGMEMPEGMGMPKGMEFPEGMEMPEGFDPGQMPEGFAGGGGERPAWNGQMPEGGEMPEGFAGRGGDGGGMGGFGGMADNGVALVYTDDELSSYSSIFDNDKTKTDEADHRRVVEAIKNLNEGTDLETYVDVDAVLRYFAAHTVVVNLDSYSGTMGHNYILYENGGQISILPWDYNMAFGGFQSGGASSVVNFPINTPVSGVSMEDRPLLARLLEVPEYLALYHQYLQEILDGYDFEHRVDEVAAMIESYVENDPTAFYTYEEFQAAAAALKELGALRYESIQGQLDGTIPATTEGQTAEPEKLVDASSIDMAQLGSMGGMGGGMGNMGGFGGEGRRPQAQAQQE